MGYRVGDIIQQIGMYLKLSKLTLKILAVAQLQVREVYEPREAADVTCGPHRP